MAPGRSYTLRSYAGLWGAAQADWPDAGPPAYEEGFEGPSVLSVPLARNYGSAGEAYDLMGAADLVLGNRVDCYVSDDFSLTAWQTHQTAFGRLVYRGTLEELEMTTAAGGWQVVAHVHPLSRIAAQSAIQSSVSLTGDAVAVARTLWANYGAGLGWDPTNPLAAGVTLTAGTQDNSVLLDALRLVAGTAGPSWHALVSRQGLIRFFDDTATTIHDLTLGAEVTDARLVKSTADRAKRVLVASSDGTTKSVVTSTDADRSTDDPRDAWVALPSQVPSDWAQAFADATLRDRNRVRHAGEVTVSADRYPIDTIQIGDRVRLRLPREQYTALDRTDYPAITVRIAQIAYALDSARLSLDVPPADLARETGANASGLAAALRGLLSA